ncbi:MAG: adenine phosphoribosyltransferase [Rubricoccaceae bacterium]
MPDRLADAVRTIQDFPKPGVAFKDLTPILADPSLFAEAIAQLATPWEDARVTHVVGMDARGFWFGPSLAAHLGAGFVPARKPGKLPAETVSASYTLEYGEDALELHADAFGPDARVLIHDDVIATGGTAAAACDLVRQLGGIVVGCSFFLELAFLAGRDLLPNGVLVEAVLRVE